MLRFRFFLSDLFNQLKAGHDLLLQQALDSPTLLLYRGQRMPNHELWNLKTNCGQIISINTFLSTTKDKDVALMFAGENNHSNDGYQHVLFTIEIDVHSTDKSFAELTDRSAFKDEEEILLMCGTIFKVTEVHYSYELRVWIVNMTKVDSKNSYDVKYSSQRIEKLLGE
ncbi:unnamed protein product, partial [Didymodactylos carnosus]